MKKLLQTSRRRAAGSWLSLLVVTLLALAGFTLRAVDEKFDTFRAGSNVFLNVTVLHQTRTDIFLHHSNGMANVKVKDVDPETLKRLGYEIAPPEPKETRTPLSIPPTMITNLTQKLEDNPQFQAVEAQWAEQVAPRLPPISKGLIAGVIGAFLGLYLFFCFCCRLIVAKTGNEPGLLVWLPILKMLPLLRAAGMPGWWFLVWLIPVVGVIPAVMWCFKIVETRGKSVLWAILLLLPVTNLVAFLYLAFSDGSASDADRAAQPLRRAA